MPSVKNIGKKRECPIRILHYIGSLNIGGSQVMIMNIYRNIDKKKIQFDFVVDKKNETFFKKEIESLGGNVFVFDKPFKGYNFASFIKQWRVFFKEHPEYRILHCHVRSVASIVLKEAKKNGLVTICHSHNISNGRGIKSAIKNLLQNRIKNYCDYFFACSKKAADWLYGSRIANSDKCIIINNAIEVEKYRFNQRYRDKIRKSCHVGDGDYLVGHVGRFEEQKNHEFIFELIEATRDRNIKYMFCGDGSRKTDFEKRISNLGLEDKVVFVPSNNKIHEYYSAFDFFILPSLYEGLGMVLIEAQYSGLNCLVSPNVPREARISDNYKVEELSVPKWVKEISSKRKNEEREKVRLLPIAEDYDVKKSTKMLEQFYMQHLEQYKGVK